MQWFWRGKFPCDKTYHLASDLQQNNSLPLPPGVFVADNGWLNWPEQPVPAEHFTINAVVILTCTAPIGYNVTKALEFRIMPKQSTYPAAVGQHSDSPLDVWATVIHPLVISFYAICVVVAIIGWLWARTYQPETTAPTASTQLRTLPNSV